METNTSTKTTVKDCDASTVPGQIDVELELARICKALGHPMRIRILQYLKKLDGCVCGRIVDVLPLAQSTVSQHLKILKEAGLIKGEFDGPRTCYCLDKKTWVRFQRLVSSL